MFYNQPLATRFGTELLQEVDPSIAPYWDTLDIAVAWVRASGMAHLNDRFSDFLVHGGTLSFVVGIDLKNTTREGLQALLNLEQYGNCVTHVYHNESGSIFHPKLYLFRNGREARLIVGSNNLTQAGLFVNVEAGLQLDRRANDPVVKQALDALATWRDTTTRLAVRLDSPFLDQLATGGYIIDERASRDIMRQEKAGRTNSGTARLFGSANFSAPSIPGARPRTQTAPKRVTPNAVATTPSVDARHAPAKGVPTPPRTPAPGDTVLMRLRIARGTQTQIPFRLTNTFFSRDREVRNKNTGMVHEIREARAKGNANTMKLELPETRTMQQPVARFERTPTGIVYEVFDVGTPQGDQILGVLEEGLRNETTKMTISNQEQATWWRFI
ncbi:MAG TPA: phospholipase D family protein [Acidobacteriaceae bacterium]|nr:phospholipase D family protein [Acidobacteriaceae bacterium]